MVAHENAMHEVFYQNPEFWVAVSFVLVVALLAYPISKMIKNMLQKRVDAIVKEISDAANLKDDAQRLLVEYERKFVNADLEAMEIIKKSQKEINALKKESLDKLNNEIKLKEKEADERLNATKLKAQNELIEITTDTTINALKKIIQNSLNAKTQDKLIDQSIAEIEKISKVG